MNLLVSCTRPSKQELHSQTQVNTFSEELQYMQAFCQRSNKLQILNPRMWNHSVNNDDCDFTKNTDTGYRRIQRDREGYVCSTPPPISLNLNKMPRGHIAHLRNRSNQWTHYLLLKNQMVLICKNLCTLYLRMLYDPLILVFRCYSLPLKNDVVLPLNKLQFPSPKVTLCQIWSKLAQWFWRRRWKYKFTDGGKIIIKPNWAFNLV